MKLPLHTQNIPNVLTQKRSWKKTLIIGIGKMFLIILGVTVLLTLMNMFFEEYHFVFHNPIEVHVYAPIRLEKREMLSPLPSTQSAVFMPQAHAEEIKKKEIRVSDIVDYIWYRESNRGKNNPAHSLASMCYEKGKVNEWGMGGMSNPICYSTRQEGMNAVTVWVEKHWNTHNTVSMLCLYSGHGNGQTCEYGETFLKSME